MVSKVVLIVGIFLVSQIFGHSYVSSPATRSNQAQSQSGCKISPPTNCSVCDGRASQASTNPTVVQRGQSLNIRWARNNHPGGFVRFAWALTAQSDDYAAFDNGVQDYYCFEIPSSSCLPANTGEPYSDDAPGLTQTACGVSITVPTWLTDGKWTLQWSWWGGYAILGDYYSCIDYQVTGGPTGTKDTSMFYGGDRTYPSATDKCLFRNTDKLRVCVLEPCNNPIFPLGVPQTGTPVDVNGQPIAIASTSGAVTTAYTAPQVTTEAAVTTAAIPVTTGVAVTTRAVTTRPATTRAVTSNQLTTGSVTSGDPQNGEIGATPCTSNDDCDSGVCDVNGVCTKVSTKGLDSGGIAAIVFALLVVVIVAVVVVFFVINKKEVPYMVPFKGRV